MTLDELLTNVPEPLRPVAARYGPALAAMTAEEIWAWIELLIAGRNVEAYRVVAARLPAADLAAAMRDNLARWDAANADNARALALQREAALAVLKVLFGVALALVGL